MTPVPIPTILFVLAVIGVVWTVPAVAQNGEEKNVCISAKGEEIVQKGTALCTSDGSRSLAMAFGDGARAEALGRK